MNDDKVRIFMELAGQALPTSPQPPTEALRKLGAQLLLSDVLEYIVDGLGLTPVLGGTPIHNPNDLTFECRSPDVDRLQMVDGLADVAYTMFWNSLALGVPLEAGFEEVALNNLEKFVKLDRPAAYSLTDGRKLVPTPLWHLDLGIAWPQEVASVELVEVKGGWFAVGKDEHGKVRKPSSYRAVDLRHLLSSSG